MDADARRVRPSHPVLADRWIEDSCVATSDRQAEAHCDSLPSRAIGLSLLEIYFERIYNAQLLFDKTAFFEGYMEDTIPDFLLKAVFALASL